jgi:photosystem II stability/assembly factor-like uncharacterized protein
MRVVQRWCLLAVVVWTSIVAYSSGVLQETSIGPPGGWAISIAVDKSGKTIYCGWHGGGIIRSKDGGNTWQVANHGLTELTVVQIAIDPINPTTLYAGTENGLFKSTDEGESWSESSQGLAHRDVWSISVDPVHHDVVYAGTAGGGIYKSMNGGQSWLSASHDLKGLVTALLVDRVDSNIVYAGTLSGGILLSTNAGDSWNPAAAGIATRRIFSLAADPVHANVVYAGTSTGVFRTSDHAKTWSQGVGAPSVAVFALAVDGAGAGSVYAGTGHGVIKSTDGGDHWKDAHDGVEHEIVWSLAVSPDHAGQVFAGTLGGGVFWSQDRGASWTSLKRDLPNQLVYAVVADPTNTNTIYAGTAGAGVYKSVDQGKSWAPQNAGLENRVVKALAIDPNDPQTLYAGAEKQFLMPGGAVFKTSDGGKDWQQVSSDGQRVFSLAVDPKAAGVVYAGTEDGRILKTIDGGKNWTNLSSHAMTLGAKTSDVQQAIHVEPVFTIILDSSNTKTIYAGTDSGIFKSLDGGLNWLPVNNGLSDHRVRSMTIDPKQPQTLYAGTGDETRPGSVFKSENGGESWSETSLTQRWILSLEMDSQSGALYAGTDHGIFRSKSSGNTWSQIGSGDQEYVLSLAIGRSHPMAIYGGTEGRGIFVIKNAEND